jgi:hypothetical protein
MTVHQSDSNEIVLMVPHERLTEILRLLGAGNTAGLIAIVAALHVFPFALYSGSLLKISIICFASGILTFSLGISTHYIVMMTRYGPYWGGPKEPVASPPPSSLMTAHFVVGLLTILSTVLYLIGLISAFVVLVEA